jgi:UDP-2,3-diacylglucosamine pyrophosphatase LpxH
LTYRQFNNDRVAQALDAALARAINQEKNEGVRQLDLFTDQVVIFSDQHKGARNGADDFQVAEGAYNAALSYYNQMGYSLITLGDVEELWEERPEPVILSYPSTFELESQFHRTGRYLRIWGNHDDNWRYPDQVQKHLVPIYGGQTLKVREVTLFRVVDNGDRIGDLLILHGHQGTLDSDTFSDFSRLIVRYLWRPFQRLTNIPSNTPATDWQLRHSHNIAMYQWTEKRKKMILIAGHTHRSVFKSLADKSQIQKQIKSLSRMLSAKPGDQELKKHLEQLQEEWQLIKNEGLPRKNGQQGTGADLERVVSQRKPSYFNTGCCCYPDGDITGIELVGGEIRLVRWPDDDGQLNRKILARTSLRDIFKQL